MTSVITGDIINSRQAQDPELWLETLKSTLKEITRNKKQWEIFRGDSFQVEIPDYNNTFLTAVHLKAAIRSIKDMDVRLAIGIGNKDKETDTVSEASGEAFIYSGERFENLKKEKVNLAIKTKNDSINDELNLYFKLLLISMDNWTSNSAEIVKVSIEHPNISQKELGKLVGIKQNTVSERQKRANLEEILDVDSMYRRKISQLELP